MVSRPVLASQTGIFPLPEHESSADADPELSVGFSVDFSDVGTRFVVSTAQAESGNGRDTCVSVALCRF